MNGSPLAGRVSLVDYWKGTFLNSAFLIPSGAGAWPEVLSDWAVTGLLRRGSADLIDLRPCAATSREVLKSRSVPRINWTNNADALLHASEENFVSRITLPVDGSESIHEMWVDAMVNSDDTLTVYVSVPFEAAYALQSQEVRATNLRLFIDITCRMLPRAACLVGAIGEELVIDGLDDARQNPERFVDWAFYGTWMTTELKRVFSNHVAEERARASEWRELDDRALFVRWTEWEQPIWAPAEWTSAVASALKSFELGPD